MWMLSFSTTVVATSLSSIPIGLKYCSHVLFSRQFNTTPKSTHLRNPMCLLIMMMYLSTVRLLAESDFLERQPTS